MPSTIALYLGQVISRAAARRRIFATAATAASLPAAVLLTGCAPPLRAETFVVAASQTANEPAATLAAPDRALLRAAGAASGRLASAFVVNPDTGQAREVSLTPRRGDGEVDYGPDRGSELSANVNRVQALLGQEAGNRPFDLLAMMAQAVRVVAHPGTLIVVSSGLSTAGGFDLRQVGWGADPRAAAATLRSRGLLPKLAGWRVIFSGLADVAGRQPPLPLPQRTTLTRYWLAICRAAGAASCTADPVTRPDPAPRGTTPVPVVPVPRVVSVRGPGGRSRTSVPADEFFAFNSHRLLPGTDAILRPVARAAIAGKLTVSITGYASPDGGTYRYNLALSAARARAVEARLLDLGVPARQIVKVSGAGTAGQPRSACYRGGRLDESVCGLLRRVVITLTPAPHVTP
jgi:outer membrane protein OmpA-like peptidoglycan-associated protein